jgi:hypothetical protein
MYYCRTVREELVVWYIAEEEHVIRYIFTSDATPAFGD